MESENFVKEAMNIANRRSVNYGRGFILFPQTQL